MGLMPLSDAANKIVGVRKIIKRWQMRTISQVRLRNETRKLYEDSNA